MTSEKQTQKFDTDGDPLSKIWVLRLIGKKFASSDENHHSYLGSNYHQYGISALMTQKSFRGETGRGVAKCQLFLNSFLKLL